MCSLYTYMYIFKETKIKSFYIYCFFHLLQISFHVKKQLLISAFFHCISFERHILFFLMSHYNKATINIFALFCKIDDLLRTDP